MVRLRESFVNCTSLFPFVFQFQDGAIKRTNNLPAYWVKTWFQFQDGAIKSNFFFGSEVGSNEFQFQDGAIKSDYYWF